MIISLTEISGYSVLAPAITGAILFTRLNKTLRILAIFAFVSLLFEGMALLFYKQGLNNLFLFHVYSFVELGFISVLFYRITTSLKWRFFIKMLVTVFVIFSGLNLIYLEGIFEFNANQRYLESMIILVLCVGYFTELMRKAEHIYLEKYPYFWLAATYLIYFAGNSLLFLFNDKLDASYWDLHSVLNLLLNLGTTVALWMGRKALI